MMGNDYFEDDVEERGVSSVIGVVLMVAVVVALAATAGIMLLDVEEPNQEPPMAGFEVDDDDASETTTVQIITIERLDAISFTCDVDASSTGDALDAGEWYDDPGVGDTFEFACDRDDVGIVGEYDDETVVLR